MDGRRRRGSLHHLAEREQVALGVAHEGAAHRAEVHDVAARHAGAAGAAYVQFPDGLIGGVVDVPVNTPDGATSTVSVAVVAIA